MGSRRWFRRRTALRGLQGAARRGVGDRDRLWRGRVIDLAQLEGDVGEALAATRLTGTPGVRKMLGHNGVWSLRPEDVGTGSKPSVLKMSVPCGGGERSTWNCRSPVVEDRARNRVGDQKSSIVGPAIPVAPSFFDERRAILVERLS